MRGAASASAADPPVSVPLLERELVFVTGKGGTGKTTVAAGLGLLAASQGKRTLVCEVDAKGSLAAAYECEDFGFDPCPVDERLWAMTMDTERSLREYLQMQLRLPIVARIGPLARTLDFVASAAPGVKEILTVGKLTYEVRERNYDIVIVDAAATGHVIGQLAAPRTINDLVQVGLVREQTGWMREILSDPARTGVAIVLTPEEMPVNETLELAGRLRAETDVELAAVIVNRVLPELFGRTEEDLFERLRTDGALDALRAGIGPAVDIVLDGARLAVTLRRTRAAHLEDLRAGLDPSVPVVYVPELFARVPGRRVTGMVADALGEELTS